MNLKRAFLATSVAGLVSGMLYAQESMEPQTRDVPAFESLDKNADGVISSEESQGSWLAGVFAQVDSNRDGFVTRDEYKEATG